MRLSKQKDVVQVKNLDTLFTANGLRFDNIYIHSKSLHQPKYQFLQQVLETIPHVKYFAFKESEEILDPSQACENSIFIFDDVATDFDNIYIHSKSLHQPKYQFLQQVLETIPQVKYFAFKESEEILDPSQACENSIFIFDDVATDKQNKIKEYFSMGRHKSVDSFYLFYLSFVKLMLAYPNI
ncbi:hypothetical protein QE152_g30664 [Popillia japonica]|uniref:Uncharacterized protein n=1 Tax=Popillia japonica TaxID=7064 RepID=A0AAW1JD81_POPJA